MEDLNKPIKSQYLMFESSITNTKKNIFSCIIVI